MNKKRRRDGEPIECVLLLARDKIIWAQYLLKLWNRGIQFKTHI